MEKVTAIFDIGKTNKKFFLFDRNLNEVYREYIQFNMIKDEDGHPTEDIEALQKWLKEVFNRILETKKYDIKAINFSSYGASLVHIDYNGDIVCPLYNYTKKIEDEVLSSFTKKYGPIECISNKIGSSIDGMMNAGIQLYWLKYKKPEIYNNIAYSLHLPQFISYIFTGIPISEHTSIGCHTALWDYEKKDYHSWVYKEKINAKLPPIVSTETSINMNYNGKRIKIGVGIHDSSSALLPYVRSLKKKFLLISTGTWSIVLNPFTNSPLSNKDIENKCIYYMRINGKPVKATRLFLGKEYKTQLAKLISFYKVTDNYHKQVTFNYNKYIAIINNYKPMFCWEHFSTNKMPNKTEINYPDFEDAYHQLMIELVLLEVENVKLAQGNDLIDRIYIDGGFSDNDVYLKLMSHYLRDKKIRTTDSSLGSALGAAMAISDVKLNSKFLKKNYALKKHVPFIMK